MNEDEIEIIRVDGRVKCLECGVPYRDHPWDEENVSGIDGQPYLHIGCDGRRLKT